MGASGAPAEYTARRPETEELRDGGLQEATLAGGGGCAARSAFVEEVMVEARLVLEPRLGGYFPHRYAGEAALGEAPLGGVEDGVARRGGFAAAGRGHPGAHALRVHEQTFVCQGEDAAGR